ncbi:FKBP-type peptidyl-prolyl cis-trans isomerase [Pedobacter westerhofensis]|uniref:peptidylprolyl isomerase n=1 Tax=Pedobacter westerhofensis TaxID=425512 RepID=A0A521FC72_9SPHI|nr:FKBP-type peptidyl-prolyl cis-trans isomerase [Pedobacter westerhofensis]SMO93759.1 FKBP-type peptidyl-prolyl cis-trans isomerase [Pedobacter westerhofensis]
MLKQLSGYILALASLVMNVSCRKDYESVKDAEARRITEYIVRNNLSLMVEDGDHTGYYYQVLNPGLGEALKNTDSVLYNIQMKGIDNGIIYYDLPAFTNRGTYVGYTDVVSHEYVINTIPKKVISEARSIPAIRNTILKLKRGGAARILLPSSLAFGRNEVGEIPAKQDMDVMITIHPDTTQQQRDDRLIQDFMISKGLVMTKDPSGVWYSISNPGNDTSPIAETSTIQTSYTGRFLNGAVFQIGTGTSFDLSPNTRNLHSWINGWRKVIPGKLRKGGKMRMIIPSRLGTGKSELRNEFNYILLPGNAVLDFDIEIQSVQL